MGVHAALAGRNRSAAASDAAAGVLFLKRDLGAAKSGSRWSASAREPAGSFFDGGTATSTARFAPEENTSRISRNGPVKAAPMAWRMNAAVRRLRSSSTSCRRTVCLARMSSASRSLLGLWIGLELLDDFPGGGWFAIDGVVHLGPSALLIGGQIRTRPVGRRGSVRGWQNFLSVASEFGHGQISLCGDEPAPRRGTDQSPWVQRQRQHQACRVNFESRHDGTFRHFSFGGRRRARSAREGVPVGDRV